MTHKQKSVQIFIPSTDIIEKKIHLVRGRKIMLDADLAKLYGVQTFRLNEAVKRNMKRFPDDFMFRLSDLEKSEVIAICDHLKNLKFSPHLPYAFAEQGVAMLSSVLNSETAVQVNIQIIRTFTKIRQMLAFNEELRRKIDDLEVKTNKHDKQFQIVFETLRKFLDPPPSPTEKPKRQIGFHAKDQQG